MGLSAVFAESPFLMLYWGREESSFPLFLCRRAGRCFFCASFSHRRRDFPWWWALHASQFPCRSQRSLLQGQWAEFIPFSSSFSLPAHVAANRLKRLVADHMLHPAGVLGGGLPVNAQAHEQIGQDSMPLVNFKSEFAPCFR